MTWSATEVKFDEVLDQAFEDGPQLVTRGTEEYVLLTRAAYESSLRPPITSQQDSGKSLWERLRCAPEPGDPEFILPVRLGGTRTFEF